MNLLENQAEDVELDFEQFKQITLNDYKIAVSSREASLIGRKEVLTGKAKFGIFGDGKELAQIVAAKYFKNGDFRSGYYRDQTFMFATGMSDIKQFFAQLYAHPDNQYEPASSGRQMNGHYATAFVDEKGEFLNLTERKNSSSDISPTAGQMVRGLGLAFASKVFRNESSLHNLSHLSNKGNEVCFVTIGDASTSEGLFWESINAAGVLKVPMAVFVWDDGYGISVPQKYQTTKSSISQCLSGMQYDETTGGVRIYTAKGWDYTGLAEVFEEGIKRVREDHIPAIFHIQEVTQPQGHSTSGSHERYKSPERLQWEKDWDCIFKLREFLLSNGIATEEELIQIEEEGKNYAKAMQKEAWENFVNPIKQTLDELSIAVQDIIYKGDDNSKEIAKQIQELKSTKDLLRFNISKFCYQTILNLGHLPEAQKLKQFCQKFESDNSTKYTSRLYSDTKSAVKNIEEELPILSENQVNGYEIMNAFFDTKFASEPKLVAFGEDLGKIGDVNQGFAGLQEKYGENRIFDTGIREASIIGQGIGLAMRGLKPIAEIQYLDYLLYGLQPLSDDVSTMFYRTNGKQKCPLIIRTRGHRLEGVWHSGSPMGMIVNSLRGMNICVPRNMTQAASMYNTLLESDEPGLVVECLNGYRLKEYLPQNLNTMRLPLGKVEVLEQGTDITIVSYGSTLRIITEAMEKYLKPRQISVELIDVQTLLPFDLNHDIVKSLEKTNHLLIVDEDVSSGASAFIFNKIIEEQDGYRFLDAKPRTITAKDNRPAYGSDGDYYSKPNAELIASVVMEMIKE